MKRKFTMILLLMSTFLSAKAQKEITPPGWSKAQSDLKKYEQKLLKQVKQYGFESLSGFTFEKKYPERENQGAFSTYSRSSIRCYANYTSTYSDIWPADWFLYPFLAKSPKNAKGEEYEFNVYVRYSRSSFSGSNGCYGTLKNNYSFHAITADLFRASGNELSNEEMLELLFEKIDYNKELQYTYDEVELKGITRIDSVKFVKNEAFTHSDKSLKEYEIFLYGDLVEYDDYAPVSADRVIVKFDAWLDIEAGKDPDLTWLKRSEEQVLESIPLESYPNCQTANAVGAKKVYKSYVKMDVPICSRKIMIQVFNDLQATFENRSGDELKDNEEINGLFSNSEDIEKLANHFYELRNGLWKVNDTELSFWVDKNYHTEGAVTFKQNIERNLSKDQVKSLKGKVSDESYKAAKYHTLGNSGFKLHFEDQDGILKITKVEFIDQLKIVR